MANIPLTISGLKEAKADLEALNKEFEKAKNDPLESRKLAKQINSLADEIDTATESLIEMNSAGQLLGVKFDDLNEVLFNTKEEILPLTSQIGEMEDRMYQLAAAGQAGNEEFVALQEETARLRKVIIDTDKSVDLLAENQGLSVFGTGITQIGESLLRLDFQTAAKDAKALNGAVGNLGAIGSNALKGLTQTVGQLGKTFVKFGASLLLNPIFLIAAAIAAIVAAIALLLDKLGFLQPILDAIGAAFQYVKDAIDSVIQAIKDLLDWLGLTDYAAQETAKSLQDSFGKIADNAEAMTAQVTAGYDAEIRLANAAGEDTKRLELEKQEAILATAQERVKALAAQIQANEISGELDEEELKKLREKYDVARELERTTRVEIRALKIEAAKEDQDALDEQRKKEAENYKKRLEERKKFEQQRLAISRQIQDLELELLDEGLQKEVQLNHIKYARLIEDTLANENLLQEEKDKLVELFREQEKAKELKLRQDLNDELLKLFKEGEEAKTKAAQEEAQKRKDYEKAVLDEQLAYLKEQYDKQQEQQKAYNEARLNLGTELANGLIGLEELLASAGVRTAGLQKTIALVQIATDTAKSISAVIAGATAAAAAGGPAAPFLIAGYIASGLGTVFSAIASAKAALQSAPSLGGSVGGGSIAQPNVAQTQQAQPSFELFGQANQGNNLSASQDVEQTIQVKAVVSETEVTDTQNKIKKIQESAAL